MTLFSWIQVNWNFLDSICSHRAVLQSTLAVCMVGGLLIVVILSLAIFVLLRRQRITKRRTLRRLLQEREVNAHTYSITKIECVYRHWNDSGV